VYGGYATNLPLADLLEGQAWMAYRYDGAELAPEHGGPARLLVPHLYLWKSAQVGPQDPAAPRRQAGVLGGRRLPHVRRPMAGAPVLGRLTWMVADVVDVRAESDSAHTLLLRVPGWPGHLPGQHVDLRLTAEDVYTAQRSYSIASAPDGDRIEPTVQRVADGEVSTYLVDELRGGDRLELRGPVGGYFVWRPERPQPVLLVAGDRGWCR
jgi:hypothetical protein